MQSASPSIVGLSAEPLDAGALARAIVDESHGAVATFVGITRATSPGDERTVIALDYEAYERLALRELQTIADETAARYGPLRVALLHRTGRVGVGEPSVAVVAAAPHRAAAFDACRYAIDQLKARVAVWKREIYADGETAWIANTAAQEPH